MVTSTDSPDHRALVAESPPSQSDFAPRSQWPCRVSAKLVLNHDIEILADGSIQGAAAAIR